MIDFDRRYVLVPVLIGVALVASGFFAAEIGRDKLITVVEDIQRSQQRTRLIVDIQSLVTDAEASQRGFVLTGDASYLEPYDRTKSELSGYLTEVQSSYGSQELSDMHGMATKLIELCAAKMNELDSTIALYRQGHRQAMSLVRTKIGQETMNALRGLVADMRTRERNYVIAETNSWLGIHQTQRIMFTIGAVLNILLIILSGYLVTREIRRRTDLASELESQVKQKTRELSELSTHLQRVSETEKSALARELHDELGGLLVAIKMDLAQFKQKLDLTQQDVQKRWERIQSALSSGIDLKRRIIEQLRPSLLDNMGLIAAIRWQASEICSAAGLKLTETYPEIEPSIHGDAAIAIFRIAQEALTNIVKHARATQVTMEVFMNNKELRLTVQDNGVGLHHYGAASGTHGISSMRQRVIPFGGEFKMERADPTGTRVVVSIPLEAIELPLSEEAA